MTQSWTRAKESSGYGKRWTDLSYLWQVRSLGLNEGFDMDSEREENQKLYAGFWFEWLVGDGTFYKGGKIKGSMGIDWGSLRIKSLASDTKFQLPLRYSEWRYWISSWIEDLELRTKIFLEKTVWESPTYREYLENRTGRSYLGS